MSKSIDSVARRIVLDDFNDTAVEYRLDICLHALIEAQAARTPHAIAAETDEHRVDYATLNAQANRLARHLRTLGVGPDVRVAICVDRGLEMVVGLLAILKAGGAYVPLDPHYPPERLDHMLSDSAPLVLLTQGALRPALEDRLSIRCPVLDLSAASPPWSGESADDLSPETIGLTSSHLAYIIYTSGSTGLPKGAMIEHRSVVNRMYWLQQTYGLTESDAVLQKATVNFDASVTELFWPLAQGARLVLARPEGHKDPAYLVQTILRHKVTTCHFIPSMLQAFLAEDGVSECAMTLRRVMCGGEALSVPLALRFHALLPGVGLFNQYGPTETTVTVTFWPCRPGELGDSIPIGRPISNTRLYLLDDNREPVSIGEIGELYVGGVQVARGYLNREELTAEKFLPDPFVKDPRARMYRTGDLGRWRSDGNMEYLGRNDFQVKVRGFRIELGEVEAHLLLHPDVAAAAAAARDDGMGDSRLVAYYVPRNGATIRVEVFREHLSRTLPEHAIPSVYVRLDALPLTPSGKLDRRALPEPGAARPDLAVAFEAPAGAQEDEICQAFSATLHVAPVGRHDNFFDLGGSSLLAVRVLEHLRRLRSSRGESVDALSTNVFFRQPTPAALAAALSGAGLQEIQTARISRVPTRGHAVGEPVAIIAMAGRFPGATDVETFWRNLCDGKDSITRFSPDELDPSIPADEAGNPSYVPARGVIADLDRFDAAFFGMTSREAELMDPQHRVFLELCWECLERGGYAPDGTAAPVGVFAGTNHSTYLHNHVFRHPEIMERVGAFQTIMVNDKGFVATRVAHKLNLTGPALTVHTSCSTSLVAICQAVDSLRAGRCYMALAGGSSATCPPNSGYLYNEGAMLSRDGRTRAFDKDASGTVFSDGAGVVLLKRLSDALADGDTIHALIRGVAINNDGAQKASYTAPSGDGQAAVIVMAHADAGVSPRSIGYVEAHGTATPLGDPIEIEGLTRAFRQGTVDNGFCRLGSVKSNFGHLVIAAGVAGVIKTTCVLREEWIPPSLHFTAPNPAIDFARTPFLVNTAMTEWKRTSGTPRLAGVSSFGVGGTNAHVVMEEAPPLPPSDVATGPQLVVLSARTPAALQSMALRLADHLDTNAQVNLADVAWTLAVGRKVFPHRLAIAATDAAGAAAQLRSAETAAAVRTRGPAASGGVVFMFPGQGSQYAGMGRGAYAAEPVFRDAFDACADGLRGELGFDLRNVVFGDDAAALLPTAVMQPAIFAIEYSLAQWWMSKGVTPAAMLGHSIGEYAAATLAGVFSLADALKLVARRGRLIQAQPAGGMLSVRLAADALSSRLTAGLSLAAENAPGACVVSGPLGELAEFQAMLEREDVACRKLHTSHAFHSAMMEPVVELFRAEVAAVERRPPTRPVLSTATAQWLDAETASSPDYWARQLREPVRFSAALRQSLQLPVRALLEVGPRGTLVALSRQHQEVAQQGRAPVPSLADQPEAEPLLLRQALGQLWMTGVEIDLQALDRRQHRRRICLPTYAFERQRYWIETTPMTNKSRPQPAIPASAVPRAEARPQVLVTLPMQSAASAPGADREAEAVFRLRALILDTSGIDVQDSHANFGDCGLDSLMLTQVALQVQKAFGVRITFMQLMRECTTLASLGARLAPQLPQDPPTSIAAAMPMAAVASAPQVVSSASLQQVMVEQLQVMAQQLALLAHAMGAESEGVRQAVRQQHDLVMHQLSLVTHSQAQSR
jgi:amino acid adenylation domain-containing protein